jgi:hypothetical protein
MNPHSHAHLFFDKGTKKDMMDKTQPLQKLLLGKLGNCMYKTEMTSMSVTLYKYHLSMDQGL